MRAVDIIRKKRDGQALNTEEIRWFVNAYAQDDVPDYQAAAFLMAVYWRGMTRTETVDLTMAMAESGKMLDLSDISDYVVDKHSSGGVGDKTTLVVLPLVAACGIPVAKMSGRGLGFSGGTLDKIEAINGVNVNLSDADFRRIARETGIVLAGQTSQLAPADGRFYALRDVTATVSSVPLIAASIMSKKLASGANGIVLDVKIGAGAFVNTLKGAQDLARTMVDIGTDAGRDVVALLSDMEQPLGHAVGNALEVREAIETLQGNGPQDFHDHCITVAAHMLQLAGRGQRWRKDQTEATKNMLHNKLQDGSALAEFKKMIAALGGDLAQVEDPDLLPQARIHQTLYAAKDGYLKQVGANWVALASLTLGAGRMKKGDAIDLAVGVVVRVKVGDTVRKGQPLAVIHANDEESAEKAMGYLQQAFAYSEEPVEPLPLFYGVIA